MTDQSRPRNTSDAELSSEQPSLVCAIVAGPALQQALTALQAVAPHIDVRLAATRDEWMKIRQPTPDLFIVECTPGRIVETMGRIREIRAERTLVPIVAFSESTDPELQLAFFKAGISEFLTTAQGADEIAARIDAVHRLGGFTRILEIQNEELLASMKRLRESHDLLEAENEARCEAESQLQTFQQQLFKTARLAALGELSGELIHEINNPLSVVLGHAENLQSAAAAGTIDAARVQKSIDPILRNVKRIREIAQGVRIAARQSSDSVAPSPTPLKPIIDDVLGMCRERFRSEGIDLKVVEVGGEAIVHFDPGKLVQVLVNLINNAHDAVAPLAEKWVRLDILHNEDAVVLALTDSGPGIPEDMRTQVFEPFFTTKPPGKGTGLGLGISRALLMSVGGSLFLDPQCPNTRFVARIPNKPSMPGVPPPTTRA